MLRRRDAETYAPTVAATLRMRWLGHHLRALRGDQRLVDAAKALELTPSTLSRWENGAHLLAERDLLALLDYYGVNGRQRQGLIRLWSAAGQTAWWDVYAANTAEPLMSLTFFESMATEFQSYSATVLDGLVQTPDYTRATILASDHNVSKEGLAQSMELRVMRQAILSSPSPPRYDLIVDEAVLHRIVGSWAVMAAQLTHLVTLSELSHIEIRVLPFTAGAHASPDGGFRRLVLPEPLAEMVAVGSPGGVLLLEPPNSAGFVERYSALREKALTPADTKDLLVGLRDALEQ